MYFGLNFEALLEEERALELSEFDTDAAMKLAMSVVNRAKANGKRVAVSVSVGRQILFQYGSVGLGPNADHWMRRKANVVYEYHMSSLAYAAKLENEQSNMEIEARSGADFTAFGGAVPIRVKGAGVIGAIAMTGLDHMDDHEHLVTAIKELMNS